MMDAIIGLAAAFGSIILVGTSLTYIFDRWFA